MNPGTMDPEIASVQGVLSAAVARMAQAGDGDERTDAANELRAVAEAASAWAKARTELLALPEVAQLVGECLLRAG